MQRRLIEALTFPRLFVTQNIGLRDCPQDGVYEPACDRCHECGLRQQCHWLTCLNSFADLARKPLHTINASLLYSIDLIETHNEKLQHDSGTCDCESCTWVRDARRLSSEFSKTFAWPTGTARGN